LGEALSPAPLAGLAVLLGFAAAWELVGAVEGEATRRARALLASLSRGRLRSVGDAARQLGIGERIRRAGLDGRLQPGAVVAAKAVGLAVGALVAVIAAPVLPGRLFAPGVGLLLAAGFLAPDAALERAARRRAERIVAALPDALDLLAVGAASGRSPGTLLTDVATGATGPLASELAIAVAEIECGASERRAVEALRQRVSGNEVGAVAAALERSRRYGSPLADQLHEQASALRRDARRRIDERAARAAPKIQLVVALVLVPSVLLAILAAIVAHSDALLAGL
jgi:tight adherence protein C